MRGMWVLLVIGCGASASATVVSPGAAETAVTEAETAELEVAEPQVAPGTAAPETDPLQAWIATLRLETEVLAAAVEMRPSWRERLGHGLRTWTSPDEATVITRYDHGVFVVGRLTADPAPPGVEARLMPALIGDRWPHYVVAIRGQPQVVPMFEGALRWRVPLVQEGDGSLDDTAELRHTWDCDVEVVPDPAIDQEDMDVGCMVFGAAEALAAIPGADTPGGWRVDPVRYEPSPDRPRWRAGWAERLDNPQLRIEAAELEEGAITRVLLQQGRRRTLAFELAERGDLDEQGFFQGVVTRLGRRLLVHFTVDGWTHYFSIHDARSGARIGEPVAVSQRPHGDPHGAAPSLEAIVENGRIAGYAVLLGTPVVFDAPGEPGRYLPMCPVPPGAEEDEGDEDEDEDDGGYDDDYEEPPYLSNAVFGVRDQDGTRCLFTREP